MDEKLKENINELLIHLEKAQLGKVKAIIGLDGFVDEIIHVVDTRKSATEYTRIKTLREYGERITRAAGLSTNVELVTIQCKLGGNGPIYSNSLVTYGLDVTYIGALGYPDVHPVFKPMAEKASVMSITNPGTTDALEFEDGKLIVSKMEFLKEISWEGIKDKIGTEKLTLILNEARLVGLENWTMVPYMSDIWAHLLTDILPFVVIPKEKNYIFFDLADPEKRTMQDILEALKLIAKFSNYYKVILGLNQKELFEVAHVMNLLDKDADTSKEGLMEDLITNIAKSLDIYCVVVHPVSEAVAYSEGAYFHTFGPFTTHPKITTGAGDHFNAGFCIGQILGLSMQLSLVLGTATSGYYVRNAKSPDFNNIRGFLKQWLQCGLD